MGAIRGLATLKFSTSPRMLGVKDVRVIIASIRIIMGRESLVRNRGLNFSLSGLKSVVDGLVDPFSCSKIRCVITKITTPIGRRKWSEKNRFRVGWDTEGPPQIHVTKSVPTRGMADRTPVITVAPQNDICPHGRTYPKNAVAMIVSRMIVPDIHTFCWFEGELK